MAGKLSGEICRRGDKRFNEVRQQWGKTFGTATRDEVSPDRLERIEGSLRGIVLGSAVGIDGGAVLTDSFLDGAACKLSVGLTRICFHGGGCAVGRFEARRLDRLFLGDLGLRYVLGQEGRGEGDDNERQQRAWRVHKSLQRRRREAAQLPRSSRHEKGKLDTTGSHELLQVVSLSAQIQESVAFIQARTPLVPKVAVVLGSGLGAFADQFSDAVRIRYDEIPNFPTSSVVGHAGELVLGELRGVPVAVMSGRIHFYEGYPLTTVTLPTRILSALGAKRMVVTNAAGGVNPDFGPGTLMVIRDHINLTGNNPLIGHNDDRLGPRFPDMSEPYSAEGCKVLREAAASVRVELKEGVYCGVLGPSYETPAEVRMMRTLGADAVGMSTVPEVIVANHEGMSVAGLSLITNAASGLSEVKLTHEDVKEVASRSKKDVVSVLSEAVVRFA